jgi:DNA polymerase delta subunit 2
VERVLDVRQGELCWVVGTVYMDLTMKPNVLADISKEVRSVGAFKDDQV